jgi:CubicO group peptidase (beta-lactamase class C family)
MMQQWKILAICAAALIGCAAAAPLPSSLVAAAAAPAVPTAHDLTKTDVDAWLDGYMPDALRRSDIPGAVVTVVKDGQILTARGYGLADVAKRTPVDPDRTLFRPGSVSKLVTWTAVMQLVEQHKLDLDADVNTYLDFRIPPFDGKPMTLRQIMTHTSGFEETAKETVFFDGSRQIPLDQFLKRWVPKRIFNPGETPAYSNWATALAGYIVQRTSGMPFDDYVEQHIFLPLGMHNSTFRQPLPARLAAQMATGYSRGSEPAKTFEFVGPAPAGSLSTTGHDMARFMLAHLQGGELDGQRILSPETAAMMHNSPLDKVNPRSLIPPLNRMQLGFFETNLNGHEVIGHLGDTDLFHTSLHLFINDGVGLFVSFNSPGKEGAVQPLRVALFQDFTDRYFSPGPPDGRVDAKTAAAHAQMMAGTWESSQRMDSNFLAVVGLIGQTKVSVGPDGSLVIPALTGPSGAVRQWVEIAPFVWRASDGHDRVAAQIVDGKVARWSWELVAPFMVYDRAPMYRSAAWMLPALYVSMGVLVLTLLSWPAESIARRQFRAPRARGDASLRAYRGIRIAVLATLAIIAGWMATLAAIFNGKGGFAVTNAWLWLLQIAGVVVFVGAVELAGWNVVLAWRTRRPWTRKTWSVLVLLATMMFLYTAWVYDLLAMSVSY